MAKITRVEHRWIDRVPAEWEGDKWEYSVIIATYRVEGRDDRLFVRSFWSEPITSEEQRQDVEPALLRMADDSAEWAVEHPDELEAKNARWAAMAEEMTGTDHSPGEG